MSPPTLIMQSTSEVSHLCCSQKAAKVSPLNKLQLKQDLYMHREKYLRRAYREANKIIAHGVHLEANTKVSAKEDYPCRDFEYRSEYERR